MKMKFVVNHMNTDKKKNKSILVILLQSYLLSTTKGWHPIYFLIWHSTCLQGTLQHATAGARGDRASGPHGTVQSQWTSHVTVLALIHWAGSPNPGHWIHRYRHRHRHRRWELYESGVSICNTTDEHSPFREMLKTSIRCCIQDIQRNSIRMGILKTIQHRLNWASEHKPGVTLRKHRQVAWSSVVLFKNRDFGYIDRLPSSTSDRLISFKFVI